MCASARGRLRCPGGPSERARGRAGARARFTHVCSLHEMAEPLSARFYRSPRCNFPSSPISRQMDRHSRHLSTSTATIANHHLHHLHHHHHHNHHHQRHFHRHHHHNHHHLSHFHRHQHYHHHHHQLNFFTFRPLFHLNSTDNTTTVPHLSGTTLEKSIRSPSIHLHSLPK